MKCIEVGARWAFWEPGHYVYSLPLWKNVLKDYNYFFMKSGSCIAAYPLVQLNKKFVMWVGTSYEDDKEQRLKNLSWFRYMIDRLASSRMRKIEKKIFGNADCILSIIMFASWRYKGIGDSEFSIDESWYKLVKLSRQILIIFDISIKHAFKYDIFKRKRQ